MILKSFFGDSYDFYDQNQQLLTNLLSGEIGSGKTSFIIQYLYYLVHQKRDKDGSIDTSWKLPFKQVHINVDGFDFDTFNSLAKKNGLDISFHWLDFKHFESFAKEERKLYTKYNSEGGGIIAKSIQSNISDEYKKYLHSLIICDEADHWLTKISSDMANFLKFKRHHGIGIWFITQKYQNLDSSFYNSGAINRFLHIRNPLFNAFGYKFIEHWSASNRQKSENLQATYNFKILPEIYDLYDSGANLGNMEKSTSHLKKYALFVPVGVVIGISIMYYLYSLYVVDSDLPVTSQNLPSKVIESKVILDHNKTSHRKNRSDISDSFVIRCSYFGKNINCYYNGTLYSYDLDYLSSLIKDSRFSISVLSSYKNNLYLVVDSFTYILLFDKNLNKDDNEKSSFPSLSL